MYQTKHEQQCFIKTFKDVQNNFVKRSWNIFVRLDTLCYYRLCDVVIYLCSLNVIVMVTDSFNFLFNSVMLESFRLLATPEFKNFHYDENKDVVKNLYSFARKTIRKITTVKVPKSRSKVALVFGFLLCILPEFILRRIFLGPFMFLAFGLLLMTSWVGVFVFVPVFYILWYVIKLISNALLVFLAIITTAFLAVCVLLIACMYFVFMTIFMFSIGTVMFLVYPMLFGIRIVVLSVIAVIYYMLKGLSVIKTYCFITDD